MAYFSIPRASCIGETLLDGNTNDTNDGTKGTYTLTNGSYASTQVGYQKQHAVFGATTSFTRSSLASIQTLSVAVYPTAASKTLFTYVTSTGLVTFDGSYVVSTTGLTNATIYVNGAQASTLTANAWNLLIITHDSATATNFNLGSSSFLGNACMLRTFNAKLTEVERAQLWHEFNRKLGGGSDFGSYIPAPTAQFEADGSNTFVDVAAQGTVTRTSGTATTDSFGITRAISAPNQSWSSVSGDSFVFWNNSGWKLEKNATGVSATGINTANTVVAVLFFPAGVISTAQQTYLENLFKARYPYAFRRSILQAAGVYAYYDGTFSTTNAYDVAGGFGTKTITGTMTSVCAQQNKAFSLSNTQYINLSGANLYDASGWWIGQWIKFTSVTDTRSECNSNTNGYWCHLAYNVASANKPEAFFWDGGVKKATGTTSVNDGKWHLCIAEFVPGTHTRIWVDGRLEATTAVGTFSSNGNTQAQYAFADRDTGGKLTGKADWMYGKGPMTSQKAQMLYFGTYRN